MIKHVEKPTLKAPTLDAIAEYALEVMAYNKAACSAIDYANTKRGANGNGAARLDRKTSRELELAKRKSIHDVMENNPEMLAAYRELMKGV
jgi:hypothetical protein